MFDDILTQLVELANTRSHPHDLVRGHLRGDGLSLYVRIGPRWCAGRGLVALVLADTLFDEDLRGQGIYTQLLPLIEAQATALGLQAVVHECVVNPRLLQFLLRQGCRPVGATNETLFKELPHEQ